MSSSVGMVRPICGQCHFSGELGPSSVHFRERQAFGSLYLCLHGGGRVFTQRSFVFKRPSYGANIVCWNGGVDRMQAAATVSGSVAMGVSF